MIPSDNNLHRGRYLLLLIGLFIVFFVVGMMILGSLALAENPLRWSRFALIAICWVVAYCLAQVAARRGRLRWLLKTPPAV